jgi:putative hemolysin
LLALLHKPFEQAPMLRAVQQIFRVPLHTQPVAGASGLDALYKAIEVAGYNLNTFAQLVYRLVMQAVDAQAASAGYQSQATAGPQGGGFTWQHRAPVRG